MKKLLGILVLGLLWCNVGVAKTLSWECSGDKNFKYVNWQLDLSNKELDSQWVSKNSNETRSQLSKVISMGDGFVIVKDPTDYEWEFNYSKNSPYTVFKGDVYNYNCVNTASNEEQEKVEEPSQTQEAVEQEEEKKNLETNCKINSTNNVEEEGTVLKKTGDVEIKDQNEIIYLLKNYIILMQDDGAQMSKQFEWNFKDDCSLDVYVDNLDDNIIKSYMIFSGSWNIKDNKLHVKLKPIQISDIAVIEEDITIFKWIPDPSSVVVSSTFGEVSGSLLSNSLFHDVMRKVWGSSWFDDDEFDIQIWDKSTEKKTESWSKWESAKANLRTIRDKLRIEYSNKKQDQKNHERRVKKYGKQCENSENYDDCLLEEEKKYWKFLDEEFIRTGGKDSLRKVINLIISCAISVDQQELSKQSYSGIKNDINKEVFLAEAALRDNNISEIRISYSQLKYLAHQAYSVSATHFGPDNKVAQYCKSIDTDF